jgi:hypothetical protein
MNFLKRLFSSSQQTLAPSMREDFTKVDLQWLSDATVPVPDWEHAWSLVPAGSDDAARQRFWWSAAETWLNALRTHLGEHYVIESSKSFALFSALDPKQRKLLLEYCERARVRILRTLEGIASSWGHGPHVVFVFETVDAYYEYIGNYYPKSGVFGMSSGMFIQHGYGHFVFVASDMSGMEPIIAHELTHCLLAPLQIPAWLNEGTAVNMEKQLVPQAIDRHHGIFVHREEAKKRAAFWNAETIQEFWSGKSFKRADEGCALSYALAEELTKLIARDYAPYRSYMNNAHREDAGARAAMEVLGYSLEELAAAVLGEGDWAPAPAKWRQGTERGQF